MAILIGIVLALVLLYFWLLGHWFARVVSVLILGPILAFGGALALGALPGATPAAAIVGAILGAGGSWFVAGLPTYYWRQRIEQIDTHAH